MSLAPHAFFGAPLSGCSGLDEIDYNKYSSECIAHALKRVFAMLIDDDDKEEEEDDKEEEEKPVAIESSEALFLKDFEDSMCSQ